MKDHLKSVIAAWDWYKMFLEMDYSHKPSRNMLPEEEAVDDALMALMDKLEQLED